MSNVIALPAPRKPKRRRRYRVRTLITEALSEVYDTYVYADSMEQAEQRVLNGQYQSLEFVEPHGQTITTITLHEDHATEPE